MAEKSKVLVIGGTGYIGKFLVKESAKSGHPTFALVRETTASDPEKSALLKSFKSSGVTLLYGDVYDHNSLVDAIKKVDVVISAVKGQLIPDQTKIIAAIKECPNVKRFLPSEFGTDVDRVHPIEPVGQVFRNKANIRRVIEAEGIPYTLVLSYGFAGYFLSNFAQFDSKVPPRDKVVILGDGNPKEAFADEEDIASYTIKAERIYTSEDQVLKKIQESPYPVKIALSILHSVFVKGDDSIFDTETSSCVEATKLYPDVKYTTVDEYLDRFV